MTKVFLDSNIWLRFFAHDTNQFEQVQRLLSEVEKGRYQPYTSAIVLLETTYVLKTAYGLPKERVREYLRSICSLRNVTIIDKTDTKVALEILEKVGVKFSDCLIASQIPKEAILVTFDKEFSKIKSVASKTPAELLS